MRRSRNAFEEDDFDDGDDDIEELTSLGGSARTRRRVNEDGDDISVEETTGLSNMTSTQKKLAKLFQPPFDIISNYDLEMVCFYEMLV